MEWKLMWLKGNDNLKGTIPSADYDSSQDRQCTYNVTLRRVRELLLPWKSNEYYIFVCVCVWVPGRLGVRECSLAYPSCYAHAPYCVICGFSDSTTFFDIIS